ncbi:hypothetical protein BD779DRAFT_1475370 [Infundibulicybe gibba]|nr:hypothetical protein BD779DRAFT_1475370 [Infundibulicybe gibba]
MSHSRWSSGNEKDQRINNSNKIIALQIPSPLFLGINVLFQSYASSQIEALHIPEDSVFRAEEGAPGATSGHQEVHCRRPSELGGCWCGWHFLGAGGGGGVLLVGVVDVLQSCGHGGCEVLGINVKEHGHIGWGNREGYRRGSALPALCARTCLQQMFPLHLLNLTFPSSSFFLPRPSLFFPTTRDTILLAISIQSTPSPILVQKAPNDDTPEPTDAGAVDRDTDHGVPPLAPPIVNDATIGLPLTLVLSLPRRPLVLMLSLSHLPPTPVRALMLISPPILSLPAVLQIRIRGVHWHLGSY